MLAKLRCRSRRLLAICRAPQAGLASINRTRCAWPRRARSVAAERDAVPAPSVVRPPRPLRCFVLAVLPEAMSACIVNIEKVAGASRSQQRLDMLFDPPLVSIQRRLFDRSAVAAKDARRTCFLQVPVAYFRDRH